MHPKQPRGPVGYTFGILTHFLPKSSPGTIFSVSSAALAFLSRTYGISYSSLMVLRGTIRSESHFCVKSAKVAEIINFAPQGGKGGRWAPRVPQNDQKGMTPTYPFAKVAPKLHFRSKSANGTGFYQKCTFGTKVLLGVPRAQPCGVLHLTLQTKCQI